jgi:hypothetical protein
MSLLALSQIGDASNPSNSEVVILPIAHPEPHRSSWSAESAESPGVAGTGEQFWRGGAQDYIDASIVHVQKAAES